MSVAAKHLTHPAVRALVSTEPKVKAQLVVGVQGKFTSWRKGEKVWAQKIGKNQYSIEKIRYKKGVPLLDCMAGVPKIALNFI